MIPYMDSQLSLNSYKFLQKHTGDLRPFSWLVLHSISKPKWGCLLYPPCPPTSLLRNAPLSLHTFLCYGPYWLLPQSDILSLSSSLKWFLLWSGLFLSPSIFHGLAACICLFLFPYPVLLLTTHCFIFHVPFFFLIVFSTLLCLIYIVKVP